MYTADTLHLEAGAPRNADADTGGGRQESEEGRGGGREAMPAAAAAGGGRTKSETERTAKTTRRLLSKNTQLQRSWGGEREKRERARDRTATHKEDVTTPPPLKFQYNKEFHTTNL